MKTYVDMDGVVADFFLAAHQLHGRDPKEYPDGEWDMCKVFGMSYEEWSKDMDAVWWSQLPKTPEADAIMDMVENPVFLTRHMDGRCVDGKEHWIKENYPGVPIVLTKYKGAVACSKSVLIDDREENIYEFRKAGGETVYVPRPWNTRTESIEIIFEEYQRIKRYKYE